MNLFIVKCFRVWLIANLYLLVASTAANAAGAGPIKFFDCQGKLTICQQVRSYLTKPEALFKDDFMIGVHGIQHIERLERAHHSSNIFVFVGNSGNKNNLEDGLLINLNNNTNGGWQTQFVSPSIGSVYYMDFASKFESGERFGPGYVVEAKEWRFYFQARSRASSLGTEYRLEHVLKK